MEANWIGLTWGFERDGIATLDRVSPRTATSCHQTPVTCFHDIRCAMSRSKNVACSISSFAVSSSFIYMKPFSSTYFESLHGFESVFIAVPVEESIKAFPRYNMDIIYAISYFAASRALLEVRNAFAFPAMNSWRFLHVKFSSSVLLLISTPIS